MPDHDALVLEDAADAVLRIDVRYKNSDINDKLKLAPSRDAAFSVFSAARAKLLAEGVICGPLEVSEMAQLRNEVRQAADTQELIVAIGRLVAFLAKLAA